MSESTVLTVNRPVWMDLSTRNMEAARRFYTGLFGWTATADPDPELRGYTTYRLDGEAIGGLMDIGDMQSPTQWMPYIGVADVRATVAAVRATGGEVLLAPMDVTTHSSVAVVRDAVGATVGLWQAKDDPGWGAYRTTHAVCWNELHADDSERATRFYAEVFGWEASTQPMPGGGTYTTFSIDGGEAFAGLGGLEGATTAHWLTYIAVDDCDGAVATATGLGATTVVRPADIPGIGRFAVLLDPDQAAIALITPLPRQS